MREGTDGPRNSHYDHFEWRQCRFRQLRRAINATSETCEYEIRQIPSMRLQ
jgi:hypothetical protein